MVPLAPSNGAWSNGRGGPQTIPSPRSASAGGWQRRPRPPAPLAAHLHSADARGVRPGRRRRRPPADGRNYSRGGWLGRRRLHRAGARPPAVLRHSRPARRGGPVAGVPSNQLASSHERAGLGRQSERHGACRPVGTRSARQAGQAAAESPRGLAGDHQRRRPRRPRPGIGAGARHRRPAVRHHLADAGYPALREPNTDEAVRQTVIAWHSSGAGTAPDGSQRWRLIPLKHLVNHHPDGADQVPVPGRTAVATSATSDAVETFENYGDLDALQLLTFFGYVDRSAPGALRTGGGGVPSGRRVVVRWRAPRNPRAAEARRAEIARWTAR